MSLQSFAAQQAGKKLPIAVGGVSLIAKFQQGITEKKTIGQEVISKTEAKPEEKEKLSKWQWISKQLMKPVSVVAVESENIGLFIGGQKAQIPGKAGLDILSGKRERSFSDIWRENASTIGLSEGVAGKIGLVFDIADDPFNFIGGGLTNLGKLATKVSSLQKAGKTILPGSKLAQQIAKSGYTAKELALAGSKAEQVAAGQRALLKIAGKPIVGGERVYKATEKLTQMLKVSKPGVAIRRTFTTKTGIKELDELVGNFNNLADARKESVIKEAADIQRSLLKMKPEETKMVVGAIEDTVIKAQIKDKNIVRMADRLENLFKQMKVVEKEKGILKTELEQYFPHIKAKAKLGDRIRGFFNTKKYSTYLGAAKGRKIAGTVNDINSRFGKEFFQTNPALAYAQRGLASAKAVTAKEFLDDVGRRFFINAEDAPIAFKESANPLFKGLKADSEVIRAVDQYMQGIKPDELKLIVRSYDRALNWWKAQALISPSYHTRNMISNFWNNWLAGVKNPVSYIKARLAQGGQKANRVLMVTDAGETLTRKQVLEEAQKRNVVGRGLYGKDIQQALKDEIGGVWARAKEIGGWMPWKQDNVLFKTNRAVGRAVEDNARLAHFIEMVQKGMSFDDAAKSVKKFLFDYGDLSMTEKNIFKRIFPFYTWTRKNIPLQIENLIAQPEKFAAIPKAIKEIEAGTPEPRTEKYMSDYIRDNVPVRIRINEKGNTEYFLLGNWLPSAQAIDFLSQPMENIVAMATPFVKTPFEIWANKSTFFKNTLGEPSKIEYYYKQPTEFIGLPMRRKTAVLMRNLRILNDLHKLIKTPAKDEPENSWVVKFSSVLIGKAQTYDIEKARYFYQRDTQQRISELEAAIKKARKMGEKEHAERLIEELRAFKKERGS